MIDHELSCLPGRRHVPNAAEQGDFHALKRIVDLFCLLVGENGVALARFEVLPQATDVRDSDGRENRGGEQEDTADRNRDLRTQLEP